MTHIAVFAALQAIDAAPAWELAKGVMLTVCTSTLSYGVVLLRQLVKGQERHEAILIGVDGKNGLRSKVDLLVQRVDAIEDRNIALDAIADAERHQWPHPDRRTGPRRMRDVTHEVLDERARRISDEYPTSPREDDQ